MIVETEAVVSVRKGKVGEGKLLVNSLFTIR